MKLFEYMASGVPIVASDLPSLREVLDESSCYLCKPDNPESLAKTIKEALIDQNMAQNKAKNALAKVREYTWSKRAEMISLFIS